MELGFKIDFGGGFEEVAPPLNKDATRFRLTWTGRTPSVTLESIAFVWAGPAAKKLNDYRKEGTNSGLGIYTCLPLRVDLCPDLYIDVALDLVHESTRWQCDQVVCPIMEPGRKDWLNDVAAGFTFSYLASTKSLFTAAPGFAPITFTDYKLIPYAISEIPDYTTVASLNISLFILGWQIAGQTRDLMREGFRIGGDTATAVAGTAILVGLEEIVRLGFDVTMLLADLVHLVILTQHFLDLFQQMIDAIIQPPKYKLGMREEDLWKKACAYLGLNFTSTIYFPTSPDYHATWIPKKVVIPDQTPSLAFTLQNWKRAESESLFSGESYGYFDGTFKEFIDAMKLKYNADFVIKNNVLYFLPLNELGSTPGFTLPNTEEVGNTYNAPNPHGTNAAELPFYYRLSFAIDEGDRNTLHRYEGTSCAYTVQQPNVPQHLKHYVRKGTAQMVSLPCALAKRKDYLTGPEHLIRNHEPLAGQIVGLFTNAVDKFLTLLNDLAELVFVDVPGGWGEQSFVVPSASRIDERIGWMLLSDDSFNVPKSFVGVESDNGHWEVSPLSQQYNSAESLMERYHASNLATRNQQLTFSGKTFPLCCKDFTTLMQDNAFNTVDNKVGWFSDLLWDPQNEIAVSADYRIKETYVNTLTENINIDGE